MYLHVHEGKWYFWDETETERIGPYATQSKARAGMECYAAELGDTLTLDLQKDGDQWCATINGAFVDLQNSFAGFGPTKDTAVDDLFRKIWLGDDPKPCPACGKPNCTTVHAINL